MAKTWNGSTPTHCDICGRTLTSSGIFVDGRTAFGPWAIMCTGCHTDNGGKLGAGRGQKYTFDRASAKWVKAGG